MKPEDQLALSFYKEIATIDKNSHVFLVQHVETEQFYVKKILSTYNPFIYRKLTRERFRNIPQIFQCIEDNNQLIVIEEYIKGRSLQAILEQGIRFTEAEAIEMVCKLCEILAPLHGQDPPLIHRDIKPSNILISSDGVLKLVDFNAAKQLSGEKKQDTVLIGTVEFAAPEQYGFAQSDARTDIYALGVLLNLLLTGKFPKDGLHQGSLTRIIETCIDMKPDNRFSSVENLKNALLMSPSVKTADQNKTRTWRDFLPPGFRRGKVVHMLVAILGYVTVIGSCAAMKIEPPLPPAELLLNKIFCGAMFFALIAFFCNYLGVQSYFPCMKQDGTPIRILGYFLGAVLIIFTFMAVLELIETIL